MEITYKNSLKKIVNVKPKKEIYFDSPQTSYVKVDKKTTNQTLESFFLNVKLQNDKFH